MQDGFQKFLGILFICPWKAYNFLILKREGFYLFKTKAWKILGKHMILWEALQNARFLQYIQLNENYDQCIKLFSISVLAYFSSKYRNMNFIKMHFKFESKLHVFTAKNN